MPAIWKERFVNSGSRLTEMARAEVIRYFHDQERQALTRQRNQDAHPRRFKTKKRPPTESAKPTSSKSSYGSKFSKQSHQHKRQNGHVANDAPCPVHPGSSHTWNDCRANHFGKHYKTNPTSTQPPKNKSDKPTDGYVADCPNSGMQANGCFIVEQLVELDMYLTSEYVDSVYQHTILDFINIDEALLRAAEDCFALGIDNPQIHIDINQSLDNQLGQQLSPVMIALVDDVQHHSCRRPLQALCDSGSALTMINPESIPPGAVPHKLPKPIRLMTAGGIVELHYGVKLTGLRFPELLPTRSFTTEITAIVNRNTGAHDIILGRDVLTAARILPNPATKLIHWDELTCPWQPNDYFMKHNWTSHVHTAMETLAAEIEFDSFSSQMGSKEILSSKYDQVDTMEAAQQQTHLPQRQRNELADVLVAIRFIRYTLNWMKTPNLFVVANTRCHMHIDVRVRWVSDFRKLNSMITRKVYNLPRIQDILKRRSHYKYFTKLDISMQYYTFELDEASKDLCTIATPVGNFRYNRLPMGIKQSPDVAQQIMEDVLRDCPEVEVYIDDIGVFSNTWEEHLASLRKVFKDFARQQLHS
ncbi:reverse transcriptase RNA-dependent DNA polymerase [Nitzschia inconspicua]|uniref:Reverse transcriptase RNA-dependent DNA polymerase n=1 Tax=Nitzschia inconspicua TaxID=303405 RepID=A0A9K3PCR7_9STRA|nr:reverse transcriptase RNA-dependent DNA polymerase [Nitzschia inconspicua]